MSNNIGIKIAENGYGVGDGDKRLVYNSDYPLFKILEHGTGTLTLDNVTGSGSKTIYTHSLGYKPMFYVWINYVNIDTGTEIEKLRMCSWREYYGVGVWSRYYAYTTTTTLELEVESAYAGTKILDYIYVIYYDPIT